MLFSDNKIAKQIVHFNTDTIFDLAVGKYIRGHNGKWLLDGGISTLMTAVTGRQQCYKSTLSQSLMTRTMLLYDSIEGMIYDSETSLLDPYARFSFFYGDAAATELMKRMKVYNKTTHAMGDMFDLVMRTAKQKRNSIKDFTVESPFVDVETGKKLKVTIPSIVLFDSYTYMMSIVELEKYEEVSIEDSTTNTLAMTDARSKSKFTRAASDFCPNSGIALMSTAHVGSKVEISKYAISPKQLQFQKTGDTIKSVGTGYSFLNSILIQTGSPKVMVASSKKDECMYPIDGGTGAEVIETQVVIQRCKNNSSGDVLSFIFSQHEGFLSEVTNYHLLKSNKYYGLDGSKISHHLSLYPDVKLSRTNIREKIKHDYKLVRALQLTAELCFIQTYWHTANIPFDIDISPIKLKEAIEDHPKLTMDEVLESRGYWSLDDKKEARKYLSIMDILEMISQTQSNAKDKVKKQ